MTSTRILIVEDDPIARGNMRDMLERAGFDCLEAEDGRVGLAIARALAAEGAEVILMVCSASQSIPGPSSRSSWWSRVISVPFPGRAFSSDLLIGQPTERSF